MADNDALRRYLEQQQEMGDRDFVLDSLLSRDVSSALRAVSRPDWRSSLRKAGVELERPAEEVRTAAPVQTPTPPVRPQPEDEMKAKKGRIVVDAEHTNEAIAKARSLKPIAEKVLDCRRCLLYSTATNGVPGEGDPKAQVVIVGEAPGANEDETGLPFVGAADSNASLTVAVETSMRRRRSAFSFTILAWYSMFAAVGTASTRKEM